MLAEPLTYELPGQGLAAAVRGVAHDAYETLNDPAAGSAAAADLLRRIDALRVQIAGRPAGPLHRWLDSLRRQVAAS